MSDVATRPAPGLLASPLVKLGLILAPFQSNLAAIGPQPPAEHRDQARLAGAVAAGQRDRLAGAKHEVQAFEDQSATAAADEIFGMKAGRYEGGGFQASAAADAFELISFIQGLPLVWALFRRWAFWSAGRSVAAANRPVCKVAQHTCRPKGPRPFGVGRKRPIAVLVPCAIPQVSGCGLLLAFGRFGSIETTSIPRANPSALLGIAL